MNRQALLEGLLFISGSEGITLNKITELLQINEEQALQLIDKLQNEYIQENHGIQIKYLGNSYKLTTKEEHKQIYQNIALEGENNVLSQSALETLAIIAYNEPITRSTINEIRGVDSTYVIRKLLLKRLIEEVGKSDLPGRPMLYQTTDKFLDYFGLKSKQDLPKLEENTENDEETDLFASKYSEIL